MTRAGYQPALVSPDIKFQPKLASRAVIPHTMRMAFYVYLLANRKNGALYCGHTDDIARRTHQHRTGRGAAFTRKYKINRLVWYELHDTREAAKTREYQIKAWQRAWKIRLIEETNADWGDLWFMLNA